MQVVSEMLCDVVCCDGAKVLINITDYTHVKLLSNIYMIQPQILFLSSVCTFDGQNKYCA
jgi:hypothetical protein